jgi:two-component system NtrC family sensor kinase
VRSSSRGKPKTGQRSGLLEMFACEGLANVSDGIVVLGADGRIVYVNRVAETAFGYEPGALVGRSLTELRERVDAGGATTFRRKDGSTVLMNPSIHDLPCPGEGGPFRVFVLRDLAEGSRLREQLIQSEKLSAIGQLVAGVAHDLNNPLTSIIGYAQLLMGRNQDPRLRRGLEVVAAEAERAARIVKNLLTVARKHVPEKRLLGLNGIVEKTLELKQHDLRVNRVEVVTDYEPHLPMTLLDFHQIQQVLLNLVINAEQAIRQERERGTIRIATRREGAGIRLVLEDDGPGIPETVLNKIFDPFFTTKPVGVGTGLGLSICHGIIAEHGGTIGAGNRPEGGARFVIDLPIVTETDRPSAGAAPAGAPAATAGAASAGDRATSDAAPAAPPAAGASPVESAQGPPGSRGLSILVVDDEAPIQDFLVALLSTVGHRVDTASSGESALEKTRKRRYDLILSDLRMPGINGMELYERLSARDPLLAQRVVFMTGDLISAESDSFLNRTANLTLAKPFTRQALQETIDRFARRFSGGADPGPDPDSEPRRPTGS